MFFCPRATFGRRVRELRKARGLTQEEPADRAGLHWEETSVAGAAEEPLFVLPRQEIDRSAAKEGRCATCGGKKSAPVTTTAAKPAPPTEAPARALLRRLIGPLEMPPGLASRPDFIEYEAKTRPEGMLRGLVQDAEKMASPTGIEPVFLP